MTAFGNVRVLLLVLAVVLNFVGHNERLKRIPTNFKTNIINPFIAAVKIGLTQTSGHGIINGTLLMSYRHLQKYRSR